MHFYSKYFWYMNKFITFFLLFYFEAIDLLHLLFNYVEKIINKNEISWQKNVHIFLK